MSPPLSPMPGKTSSTDVPDDARGEDKKSKKANLKRAGTVDPQDQWEKQKAIQRAGTSDPQEQWSKEIAIRPSTNTKCREEKEVRGKKTEDMEARRMSSARATHEDIGGLLNAGKSSWLVAPDSRQSRMWDLVVGQALVFTGLFTPWEVAFLPMFC